MQTNRYKWTIETFLPLCAGKRILEAGCGSGGLLKLLQAANDVVGVDASEDGIAARAARKIEGHCMDPSSEPLPFADEFFDIVICLETMEHLMSPYYALMEMRRVLKARGSLICSVPNPIWAHIMLYPGLCLSTSSSAVSWNNAIFKFYGWNAGNGRPLKPFFHPSCVSSRCFGGDTWPES